MTKKQQNLYNYLLSKPGYLKKSSRWLYGSADTDLPGSYEDYTIALKQARIESKARESAKNLVEKVKPYRVKSVEAFSNNLIKQSSKGLELYESFSDSPEFGKTVREYLKKHPQIDSKRVKPKSNNLVEEYLKPVLKPIRIQKQLDTNNVIFLPDLHAPFIKEGVLEFCKEQQLRYNCGTVIFAGDIIDGHAWSYHEHDPDGMSVGDELSAARKQLIPWFKAFPNAISLMGNHDLLIQRKARTIGLSAQFIKGFGDVIGAPKTWRFDLEHTKDNVLYKHGSIGDAFKVAKESRISTVQGHFHARTFVQWSVSEKDAIFGMQVGWGADRHAYAFDYGKSFTSKPIISCGLVLDKGTTPIVKLMKL